MATNWNSDLLRAAMAYAQIRCEDFAVWVERATGQATSPRTVRAWCANEMRPRVPAVRAAIMRFVEFDSGLFQATEAGAMHSAADARRCLLSASAKLEREANRICPVTYTQEEPHA